MLSTIMLCASLMAQPVQTDTLTVFLGDSRTVGMDRSVDDADDEIYIAKGSMGYDYLKNTAWPEFERVVEDNGDKHINAIINFGVNDLKNEEKYASFINEESRYLPDNVSLSWASVNPTNGSYSKMTERIKNFNERIKEDLNSDIGFIDSYTYLTDEGFNSFDGLHYGTETNKKIHDYWVACLSEVSEDDVPVLFEPQLNSSNIKEASQSRTRAL